MSNTNDKSVTKALETLQSIYNRAISPPRYNDQPLPLNATMTIWVPLNDQQKAATK